MRAVRWLVVLLLVLTVFPAPSWAQAAPPPGATYTPLATPTRILDTRTPIGGHQRKVAAGETVALAVPGLPAGATAVVVNLTGTDGTTSTFLSMFPDQYAGTSTLNLEADQTAAAGAFVALGSDGRIRVLNRNGTIDVVVDLVGYFAAEGAGFTAAAAATRILDTRSPGRSALAPGETTTLVVRGTAGVPGDATAALVNVTGVAPTSSTYLRVTPDGSAGTSTVNLAAGVTRANVTVTRIGADGAVRITNNSGTTHVLVDVLGWFGPSGTGRYLPLPDPKRVLDTRAGTDGPIAAGTTRQAYFTAAGVPDFENVVTLFTLTAVQPTARTYLNAWRHGTAQPPVSTLSAEAGATVPNTAVVGGTAAEVYNHAGSAHALVDAVGYFYAPTRPDPTVPGAPTLTSVRNHGTKADLSWSAPDDGGLPITGYTVTLQPGDRRLTVSQTTATIDGLTIGGRYTITVTATNLAGEGPASAPTPIGPPTYMTRVDTTATGQSDPESRAWLGDVSADGRYVLLSAKTTSVLVPAAYRTAEDQGTYQVRKDRVTGAVEITSVGADGVPVLSGWSALAPDNRTLVFTTTGGVHVRDLVARTTRTVVAERGTSGHTLSGDGRWVYWTAQRMLFRYDLQANQAQTLLSCPDPSTGCHLASGPVVSDDGATVVFQYSPDPGTWARAAVLDPATGELRMLTETDETGSLVLSGDGATLFYRCDNCPAYTIRKVSTAPGATPVTVRQWPSDSTMTLSPNASSVNGEVLGYFRQRRDGDWFLASTGWVVNTATGREAMLPQLRDTSYLSRPVLSADGSIAVAVEDCKFEEECGPTGVYAVSVPDLLSSSG